MKSLKDKFWDLVAAMFLFIILAASIFSTSWLLLSFIEAMTTDEVEAVAPEVTVIVVGDEEIETTVVEEIVLQSQEYGVNTDTALRIAWCESRYDDYARNPESTATGVYQFLNSTWEYACTGDALNYKDNIRCFMEQYPKNPSWWVCT